MVTALVIIRGCMVIPIALCRRRPIRRYRHRFRRTRVSPAMRRCRHAVNRKAPRRRHPRRRRWIRKTPSSISASRASAAAAEDSCFDAFSSREPGVHFARKRYGRGTSSPALTFAPQGTETSLKHWVIRRHWTVPLGHANQRKSRYIYGQTGAFPFKRTSHSTNC
jgi:hypothetical protein